MLCFAFITIGANKECSDNSTVYHNNPHVVRCARESGLVLFFFFVYMLITAIVLINLLIAIFRLFF